MSNALYRLGRFAARRPWAVIGSWLVLSVLVVGAGATVGQQLEDSFGAPGLDSHEATELLAGADAGAGGLTAQVVMTPHDTTATFLDAPELRAELTAIQEDVRDLPNVLSTSDPAAAAADPVAGGAISEDGRVALLRVQYPVLDDLTPADLANLEDARRSRHRKARRSGSRWGVTSSSPSRSRPPGWGRLSVWSPPCSSCWWPSGRSSRPGCRSDSRSSASASESARCR